MANLYLELGTELTVNPPLGYSLLGVNVGVTQVTQNLIIQIEKLFPYYNPRFLAALNNGTISQTVYDAITINQGEARQVYELDDDLQISKQLLIDLAINNNIPNIDTEGGTSAEIVEDFINEGYMIVNKI